MEHEPSEIEKLTERIGKDPKSKLFVPLAEEYKKLGDLEMAVHVLTEGLKHNPGYITAKSFLGRLLLERGDLDAAKKEFEAVVKAIPDNLLAQRKLGDICALQVDNANALRHYRAVLALNSKDGETASLVADLEAGKPVKDKLAGLIHAAPAPAEARETAAAPAPAQTSAPAMQAPPPPRKTAASARDEEPEEVLFVEPLEDEAAKPAGAAMSAGLDFLVERNEPPPADVLSQREEQMPAVGGTGSEGSIPESGTESPPIAIPAEQSASPAAATGRSSDEFTTNTLAELYIAQGFYDKAIDIYQRLLDDNPDNRALKTKLAELRGLAGSTITETPTPEFASPPVEPFAGAQEEFPPLPAAEAPPFGGPVGEEYVPPPAAAPFEGPTDEQVLFGNAPESLPDLSTEGPREFAIPQPEPQAAPTFGGTGPFDAEFAPVEYQPPQPVAEEAPQPPAKPLHLRKETIAKLEQWLQNISKEKGR